MAVIDIAIDMGSTYTTIFKKGSGIVLREPTAICLQKTAKGNKVKEIGNTKVEFDVFKYNVSRLQNQPVSELKSLLANELQGVTNEQ